MVMSSAGKASQNPVITMRTVRDGSFWRHQPGSERKHRNLVLAMIPSEIRQCGAVSKNIIPNGAELE
jgi:hypothetical protein